MKKEWFFDRFCGEQIAVYTEDGKIVEIGVENENHGDTVGNIYKAKVMNVVHGMQAAFVNCGMERNCYLPLDGESFPFGKYAGARREGAMLSLREGDELLVQIVQPPRGNKGAKVTADLSFVGKNLIYLPQTNFVGISHKISDGAVRDALLKEVEKLRAEEQEGFIVRTAATTATKRHLKTESEYLRRVYRSVTETASSAPVGSIVYREYDLPLKVMRDSLGGVTKLYVGNGELYEKLLHLARMRSDLGEKKIVRYTGENSLFAAYYQLEDQIYELADMEIKLANGGYLVVNHTEAMTVFDVNTGRYTGDSDLESTVFETNKCAAREIARQVRLRNIGGIVAVDFIDMAEETHREAVSAELEAALADDRAKSRVLPMSDLCVTLFTRKRTNQELASFLLNPCKHCTRQGYVLSDIYMAMRIRSAILKTFAAGYQSAIAEVNAELMPRICAGRFYDEEFRGVWKGRRIYLIPRADFAWEQIAIRGDNNGILTLPDNAQILY